MSARPRTLRRLKTLLVLSSGAALLFAGCGRPPAPGIDNLYRGLNQDLPRLDPRLLAGRRIVVDPGHGGHFAGTRGPEGLDEASVNLGVALYLWGLLHEAGAEAYLTRAAEKDLLYGPDSTVAADLQVRVDMIESVNPDIVVSIHHNAQPQRDPVKNAVETYYKMGDPASRDLAFAVHRHLMRNLGIEEGEVRPGGYYILRGVNAPAILGEASYLTHPPVEAKLRLSEKQRLEAEAYFLGILEYFSRGTPIVEALEPAQSDSVQTDIPTLAYAITDAGGLGIDPSGVDMTVNGAPAAAELDPAGTTVRYRLPWDAPNATYAVTLSARNVLGNTSRVHERTIRLNMPAEHAVFSAFPETLPSGGGAIFIRARLLDRRGLSVADGETFSAAAWRRASALGAWDPLPSDRLDAAGARVRRGVADFVVDVPPGSAELRVSLSCAADSTPAGRARSPESRRQFEHVIRAGGAPSASPRSVVVLDGRSQAPVEDAYFVASAGRLPADYRSGRFVLVRGEAEDVRVHAPGYRPAAIGRSASAAGAPDTVLLEPWYEGRLTRKRIVIHPEGEVRPKNARGRLGLSGAHVSLQVARYLREYLEAAGAGVRLARWTEETPIERDVAAMTNRFSADHYVEIRYRGGPEDGAPTVRTFHFPGSSRGRALAAAVGDALALAVGSTGAPPLEAVTFALQQTACPAVIIEPPSMGSTEEELRLSEPWYQRRQAYGIFCGILRHAGAEETGALALTLTPDPAAGAHSDTLSNWLVTVDDTWRLLTSPDGAARFDCLPPGTHRVELRRAEQRLRPVEAVIGPGDVRELRIAVPHRP